MIGADSSSDELLELEELVDRVFFFFVFFFVFDSSLTSAPLTSTTVLLTFVTSSSAFFLSELSIKVSLRRTVDVCVVVFVVSSIIFVCPGSFKTDDLVITTSST